MRKKGFNKISWHSVNRKEREFWCPLHTDEIYKPIRLISFQKKKKSILGNATKAPLIGFAFVCGHVSGIIMASHYSDTARWLRRH